MKKKTTKKKTAPKKKHVVTLDHAGVERRTARKRDDYEEIDATDGFAVSMEYTGED